MEGGKKKILIVDDDGFLLDMYALKFSQNNFEVYTATSGVEALQKCKNGLCPDVMLVDIIMPEMDGFEMLEKMNTENISRVNRQILIGAVFWEWRVILQK